MTTSRALAERGLRALALAAALAAVAAPGLAQRTPQAEVDPAGRAAGVPAELTDIGFDQKIGERVPADLAFRDESGRAVTLGDYLDGERPVLLSLVYYECPMLCDLTLSGLAASMKPLTFDVGADFQVVSVSFDPGETPATAAAAEARYVPRYGRAGAEDGWHFLTGDAEPIRRLTEAVGFRYSYDEERDVYAHAAGAVLLTPDGRIARYFFGTEYPPKDLRLGLVEAAEGGIGTPVDQVLLYCYQYDPATGRYSAATMNLIRAGGVLTVLALGGFIGTMLYRERRRARTSADAHVRTA
ncbi:MAG TPA: SCO family protein [Thermoanaerobaculia bacterium]|nr:SCO family protein [Thermoanaerobaculia bacterium]